jgi:membrane protein implicated in regulation of membrane protease activity
MIDFLGVWWVWMALGLLLGLAEVLLPGFIFLGFALGAFLMAGVVLLFPSVGLAWLVAIFATLSLLSWVALRIAFRKQSSGARVVTRDINDN